VKLEGARVLPFQRRAVLAVLSPEDARVRAIDYLSAPVAERTESDVSSALSHPDVVMEVCRQLRSVWDTEAPRVAEESEYAYRWVDSTNELGVFDERDYFRGEFALIAGGACRHLGRLDEAETWLDKSDAAFSLTVNPAPNLASVRYARVALHYARMKYERVIELAPELVETFNRLGMSPEALKAGLVYALALRCVGRSEECLAVLNRLASSDASGREAQVTALIKLHQGEQLMALGRISEAGRALQEGANLVDGSKPSLQLAYLHAVLGEALQLEGRLNDASAAYRAAAATYRDLSMPGWEAYMRLALAENLLAAGDHRQAEWEVLAAIPAIDAQHLAPHARMAVEILARSVRARRTDPKALSELRSYLKTAS
jgi:tetratricopeptide (TPR) repeat protein